MVFLEQVNTVGDVDVRVGGQGQRTGPLHECPRGLAARDGRVGSADVLLRPQSQLLTA